MREVVGFHLKIRAFVLKALYTHIYIIIIIIKIIIIYIYALYIYMHQFYITKCLLPGELTSSVATVVTGQPYIYMHIHELFNNIYICIQTHNTQCWSTTLFEAEPLQPHADLLSTLRKLLGNEQTSSYPCLRTLATNLDGRRFGFNRTTYKDLVKIGLDEKGKFKI